MRRDLRKSRDPRVVGYIAVTRLLTPGALRLSPVHLKRDCVHLKRVEANPYSRICAVPMVFVEDEEFLQGSGMCKVCQDPERIHAAQTAWQAQLRAEKRRALDAEEADQTQRAAPQGPRAARP